jgi:hypothetical protein
MNEIDKDFYCVTGFQRKSGSFMESECYGAENRMCCEHCTFRHRKYPTPEQYKDEYGEEVPDDMAVYVLSETVISSNWKAVLYIDAKFMIDRQPNYYSNIVIACTPFGAPPDDWSPE